MATVTILSLGAVLKASEDSFVQSTPAGAAPYPDGTYATVPGARLYYIDTGGSGVPVVLMHAATGSSQVWEYQIPPLTAAGYRVIAFDRRGRGRTEIVHETGPQPGAGADDLRALIGHLGIDRFHLIGTAAGAIVSLDVALSWPERIRSLVIANTTYGVQDPEYLALAARLRPQPQFNQLPPDLRELGSSYRAADAEGARRWIELERSSRPPEPVPAQENRNRITFALLEGITLPMLLITGDADLYTPPSGQRMFTERLKHAESLIIAESGHSAYWEQPEVFNRAVLAFIQRIDREGR